MHRRRLSSLGILFALGAVALSACSDSPSPTAPAHNPTFSASGANASGAQIPELTELTRVLALALQDPGMRERVKADMRRAANTEHKLHFRTYLRSQSGRVLAESMAHKSGRDLNAVLALAERAWDLEFYMPVEAHRARWAGGSDVLAAAAIGEESVIGFNLQGESVPLTIAAAPTTPVLVLAPVETNFSRQMNRRKARNVGDQVTCPPTLRHAE